MTESQVAEEVARIVAAQTGRDLAIDGNYVSKLERGVITWPNHAYRQAFRTLFDTVDDAELGFYSSRTRKDATEWVRPPEGGGGTVHGSADPVVSREGPADRQPQPDPRPVPSRWARKPRVGLPSIRWAPLPLALIGALIGWLVFGALQGQSSASEASLHGQFKAGGLELTVRQMAWTSADTMGRDPTKLSKKSPMNAKSANNKRLHIMVTLQNITSAMQKYDLHEFRIIAKGGQSWPIVNDNCDVTIERASVQPNYSVNLDVYFDVPVNQSKGLSIEWSRGGGKVDFPVNTSGVPASHSH